MKVLILMMLALSLFACSKDKPDAMKECMKSFSHMQCVEKLNKQ